MKNISKSGLNVWFMYAEKNSKNKMNMTNLKHPEASDEPKRTFEENIKILNDLLTIGILTEIEYKKKIEFIAINEIQLKVAIRTKEMQLKDEKRKKEIQVSEERREKIIDEILLNRTQPLLLKLTNLKKDGILTDDELNAKKKQVIKDYTKQINDEIDNPKIAKWNIFEKKSKNELTAAEIKEVKKLERKLISGDAILKSKETKIFSIYSKADLNNIISLYETDKFLLIENDLSHFAEIRPILIQNDYTKHIRYVSKKEWIEMVNKGTSEFYSVIDSY